MRNRGRFLSAVLEGVLKPSIRPETKDGGPALAERLVAGGCPEPLNRTPGRARQWRRQYLRSVIERDVQDIARVRDADELSRLLELLAVRSAHLLNVNHLAGELGLHRETVERYLSVLERLFLVRRLRAWHRNTAKRLIKSSEGSSAGRTDLPCRDARQGSGRLPTGSVRGTAWGTCWSPS